MNSLDFLVIEYRGFELEVVAFFLIGLTVEFKVWCAGAIVFLKFVDLIALRAN